MRHEEFRPAHNLNDEVLIARWRATGTVVARLYSPLRDKHLKVGGLCALPVRPNRSPLAG